MFGIDLDVTRVWNPDAPQFDAVNDAVPRERFNPVEAWESLAAQGLIPMDWIGATRRFELHKGKTFSAHAEPRTRRFMVRLASNPEGVLTAEALAQECASRLDVWLRPVRTSNDLKPRAVHWRLDVPEPRAFPTAFRGVNRAGLSFTKFIFPVMRRVFPRLMNAVGLPPPPSPQPPATERRLAFVRDFATECTKQHPKQPNLGEPWLALLMLGYDIHDITEERIVLAVPKFASPETLRRDAASIIKLWAQASGSMTKPMEGR